MKISILCTASLWAAAALAQETVTTGTLLREMVDMPRLARFPEPRYRTVQFSSYDRTSRAPYSPGWYANADGFGGEPRPGFVRTEKEPGADGVGVYVMAEVDGPGAIVRTWTAMIGGTIRIFLDGAMVPIFEGEAGLFLQDPYKALGGEESAVPATAFHQREAGYFPVPFAKGCRILWTGKKDECHFYQIQVRCYEAIARVATFRAEDLKTHEAQIARTALLLENPNRMEPAEVIDTRPVDIEVAADARATLFSFEGGPAAVGRLTLRAEAPSIEKALRQTVLRIYFDDAPTAQVEAPLGDFFGAGPGICPYMSIPFTVAADGAMTCRFAMPFAKKVRIDAENWSGAPAKIGGAVTLCRSAWDEKTSMHFFARWRVDHGLLAYHNGEVFDLPFLCATGMGVYVGTAIMIMNPTPVPTPWGGWWGEGDEKIWIDGEAFPSTFGTGSEDYFNYAWSDPDIFAHPYFAQPQTTGPGNRGHVVNDRWHIIDGLPFTRSIFFFMELSPHRETPGMSYARLAYFYAVPAVRDDHVPLRPEVLRVPELPPWLPVASHGCAGARFVQSEGLPAAAKDGAITMREASMFAGGRALWWKPGAPDDTLSLTLNVPEKGTFRLGLTAILSPECDHARVMIDGEPMFKDGQAIPLRTPYLTILRGIVGDHPHDLSAGDHTVTLRSLKADGTPGTAPVGLDFLWLVK